MTESVEHYKELLQAMLEQNQALHQQNSLLKEQIGCTTSGNSDSNTTPSSAMPSVSKVAVKLPTFWADKPAVWFAQAEAQFELSGITTESTKYNYVISQLDSRVAAEVQDIIINPPEAGSRFRKLKEELIKRLSISEEQRVRQLISDEELGDRRPSQFLRHLRSLAGGTLSDDNIIRQLWLRRMPGHVQAVLAAQAELAVDKVAEIADKIMEVSPTSTSNFVHATAGPPDPFENIKEQLSDLVNQVSALNRRQRPDSRSRSRSNSRSGRQAPPNPRAGEAVGVCWYHRNFQSNAFKCTKPCSWVAPTENPPSSQ